MDMYDKLIERDHHQLFCVLFKNQYNLDKEEINEIFLQYGCVKAIKCHGKKAGIWFIRYSNYDEAVRAVQGLQDHPTIKLLEHNNKKQIDCSNSEKSQDINHRRQNCNGEKFIQQFSRQNSQKSNQPEYIKNGKNKENGMNDKFNGNVPWGCNNLNGNQNQTDLPWGQKLQNGNQKQNNLPREQKNPNAFPNHNNPSLKPRNTTGCQRQFNEVPNLVDHNRKTISELQNLENEIPDLVPSSRKVLGTRTPYKMTILPAQEVIVANIHPKFGAAYILHLFDRFEPLAISNIMVEPKSGKRYCHVYFKTVEESNQAQMAYDKTKLLDQKLVVLRTSQLIETRYFK